MAESTPPASVPPPSRIPPAVQPVAFLGLGRMGAPMAIQIAKKGFPLTVWNRTADRAKAVVTLGAKLKPSPKSAVEGARVIITMLSDEAVLLDVLTRPEGVLSGIEKDAVVVDMSTIGRAAALKVDELVRSAGGRFVDAPVSGTIGPAEKGELVALVGGRLNDLSRVQPVLQAMCKKIIQAGDVGHGQALKVVLNGVGAHEFVAFASMLVLGEKVGLSRRTVLEAFAASPFSTPSFLAKRDKILAKDFEAEFTLALGLKDARLNIDLQQEAGTPLPVHRELVRAIEKAIEAGHGEEDLYALEKYYRDL